VARSAIHPGEHLAEAIAAVGITATQLARDLKAPPNRITAILQSKRTITADTALRLARYFGTSAAFWMNLQQIYDLRLTEAGIREILKKIPQRERANWRISINASGADPIDQTGLDESMLVQKYRLGLNNSHFR
jgi:antitoxin HigA-1